MHAIEFDSFRLNRSLRYENRNNIAHRQVGTWLIAANDSIWATSVLLANWSPIIEVSPLIKRIERPSTQVSSIHCRLRVAEDGRWRAQRWRRRTRRGTTTGGDDADANQICHLYLMNAVMKSLFACEQNAENANWEMGVRVATRNALASPFLCHYIFLEVWARRRGMAPSPSRSWLAIISHNGTDTAFSALPVPQ